MRRSLLFAASLLAFLVPAAAHASPADARYADDAEGVFWFLHISDLHTGTEMYPNATTHLALGLGEAAQVIHPAFTVATGDLVDASPMGIPTTGQDQAEWDLYKQLYTAAAVTPQSYIDLPGNHDGYGDTGFSHYLANSLLGTTQHALHTSWTVTTSAGEYYFHGLDSAGNGSGPFVESPEFLSDQIAALQTGLAAHASARLAFVLAHHRLSQPKNGDQVTSLLAGAGGGFYLHGHVHEYDEYIEAKGAIVVNEVNSLGKADTDNLAVGVVDHDAFVYRATSANKPWPFVVVTAPVSRSLRNGTLNPYGYTVCKDRPANPVRALVFAKSTPSAVTATLGSLAAVTLAASSSLPEMWSGHFDASSLSAGTYELVVSATVGADTVQHKLSVDLTDGPCEELPDAGVPDAAAPDGGEAGQGGGGAAGAGGSGGTLPENDAGADAGATDVVEDPGQDGGCSCRAATTRPAAAESVASMLLLVLGLGRRRAKKQRAGGDSTSAPRG